MFGARCPMVIIIILQWPSAFSWISSNIATILPSTARVCGRNHAYSWDPIQASELGSMSGEKSVRIHQVFTRNKPNDIDKDNKQSKESSYLIIDVDPVQRRWYALHIWKCLVQRPDPYYICPSELRGKGTRASEHVLHGFFCTRRKTRCLQNKQRETSKFIPVEQENSSKAWSSNGHHTKKT